MANKWVYLFDEMEKKTGKKFGDPKKPLLVSCRSGAKFSMPGMMDTALNTGLNDETAWGLAKLTGDERFVYDSYRRLVQMFGSVVIGMPDEAFEEVITAARTKAGVESNAQLSAENWKAVLAEFKIIFNHLAGRGFPEDPFDQLKLATGADFKSWKGKRAIDYRNAAGIAHDLGTAGNIVAMVFGNMGDTRVTGVAMTRNSTTGEKRIEGDYLTNAQGEDVVAGIGLCRTEHMFFETERLPYVQKIIMSEDPEVRGEALDELLPFQRGDFADLFRVMDGLPVIIRLIDPPLHEFLPGPMKLMQEQDVSVDYKFGTMIEIPRAALTADRIAEYAAFFSFGTNDLTQTTFGISRDDAEAGFLVEYIKKKILPQNPFTTIERNGVGELMKIAVTRGRATNPDLEFGICGEHGGDPQSIALCHELGLTYVSCSPFRVPITRLASAQAALVDHGAK